MVENTAAKNPMKVQKTRFGINTILCSVYVKVQKSHSTKEFFEREAAQGSKTLKTLKN